MSNQHPDDERPPLDPAEQHVASLLREHFEQEDDACFACDLEGYVAGRLAGPERRAVDAHLASCPTCRDALPLVTQLHDEGAFALAPFDPAALEGHNGARAISAISPLRRGDALAQSAPLSPSPRAPRSPRRWWPLLAAAAAIVVVAATAVTVGLPGRDPVVPKGDDPTAIGTFDTGDAIHLAVLREGVTFRAAPDDRLRDGDLIRFFYSATSPGYVGVFHLDINRRTTVLHPATGARTIPIAAGLEVALDAGVRVEAGDTCEWVVAVFSDAPLPVAAVRDAITGIVVLDPMGCRATVHVPGARSVSTAAVRQ